jgi:superfamily II DNA or RNA helicase
LALKGGFILVQITISNVIRIRGLQNTRLRAEITAALTIKNPKAEEARIRKKRFFGDPLLYLYRYEGSDLIVPRGFEHNLWGIFKNDVAFFNSLSINDIFRDQTDGNLIGFGDWNDKFKLRDYQTEAVNKLTRNGILVAPAGSGKTNMGLHYLMDKRRPALWLTHTAELMNQTKVRAESLLSKVGEIGLIGNGKFNYGSGKLIIAMVQTLRERPEIIQSLNSIIGTVVIDECHHIPSFTFLEVISQFKAKNMIGVTATPDRKDKLDPYMFAAIGPLLHTVPRQELIDNNQLLTPEVKFIYTDFVYEQASNYNHVTNSVDAGGEDLDFHDLLKQLTSDKDRLKLVSETVVSYHGGYDFSIVVSESVRYCYAIKDMMQSFFCGRGEHRNIAVIHGPLQRYCWRVSKSKFAAEQAVIEGRATKWRQSGKRYQVYVPQYTEQEFKDWNITSEKRKEIMKLANDRQIDILIVTQLGKEGLDLPHLTKGFLTTPMKGDSGKREDGSGLAQYVGRIQRVDPKSPGKKPVWFDFVDLKTGVLKAQYYSRRKVYTRLGVKLSKAPKQEFSDFDQYISFGNLKI